jgi:hypothetical protein
MSVWVVGVWVPPARMGGVADEGIIVNGFTQSTMKVRRGKDEGTDYLAEKEEETEGKRGSEYLFAMGENEKKREGRGLQQCEG